MKKEFSKQNLNELIASLLGEYTHSISQQEDIPPPHFMTRVQARIRAKQSSSQYFWETGIVRAQRWLVAFSLIALIFFVSNLVSIYNPTLSSPDSMTDALALTDHDWDHINDEPLPSGELVINK